MPEREVTEFGRSRHCWSHSHELHTLEDGRILQVGLMTSRYLLYSAGENPGLARGFGQTIIIVTRYSPQCRTKPKAGGSICVHRQRFEGDRNRFIELIREISQLA